jgi:hypothetical protein
MASFLQAPERMNSTPLVTPTRLPFQSALPSNRSTYAGTIFEAGP